MVTPPPPPPSIESTAILGDLGARQNVLTLKILHSYLHSHIISSTLLTRKWPQLVLGRLVT